jgi:hypothetical protein
MRYEIAIPEAFTEREQFKPLCPLKLRLNTFLPEVLGEISPENVHDVDCIVN